MCQLSGNMGASPPILLSPVQRLLHLLLHTKYCVGDPKKEERGGRVMRHVYEAGEVNTGFCWRAPEGKKQLGRPKNKWEDKEANITVDLQEV